VESIAVPRLRLGRLELDPRLPALRPGPAAALVIAGLGGPPEVLAASSWSLAFAQLLPR
jgi:hypothetical protein